ncbi:MAG: calcium-binding protein [Actinomycetota bacterium]
MRTNSSDDRNDLDERFEPHRGSRGGKKMRLNFKQISILLAMPLSLIGALAAPVQAQDFTAMVDRTGWVNVISGSATVSGTVSCPEPGSVSIEIMVSQERGNNTYRATDYLNVDNCLGTQEWQGKTDTDYSGEGLEQGAAAFEVRFYWSNVTEDSTVERSLAGQLVECTKIGTLGDDHMSGTRRNDILCGSRGNDTLLSGRGDDALHGGPGGDDLRGESGIDKIFGGLGNDGLSGGTGNDRLVADEGSDRLNGGTGRDSCDSGRGADRLRSCEQGN